MKNVLVLYNGQSMYTPTVQDYLDAFRRYSRNNIHYLHVYADTRPEFSFDDYDVVLLTYSVRLCYLENMSPQVRRAIANFRGLKVAAPQDEYQETNKLRVGLREFGVKLVLTCVPEDKIAWVYPPEMFPGVRFVRVLTGYVPDRLRRLPRDVIPPLRERKHWIGYRGRHIGYYFGDLSYFKFEVGRRFEAACDRRGVPHDIAWDEQSRIYQKDWFPFIASCRATLGTPSGSNIFDFDGALERDYKALMMRAPDTTYEVYRPTIAQKEIEIDMGQASPRLFEAAALGTALLLVEGNYSGVVSPGVDCITVKPDFSNVDAVLDQLGDVAHMQRVVEAAHENIIASGKWGYDCFVGRIDDEIDRASAGEAATSGLGDVVHAARKGYEQGFLETLALKSPAQYPLSIWLDLSHLRETHPAHETVYADAHIHPPVATSEYGVRRPAGLLLASLWRLLRGMIPVQVKAAIKSILRARAR